MAYVKWYGHATFEVEIDGYKFLIDPWISNPKSPIRSIDELPKIDFIINTGVYIANPDTFSFIEKESYLDMPDFIRIVKGKGGKVVLYPHHGEFFDIGQWEIYKESIISYLSHIYPLC